MTTLQQLEDLGVVLENNICVFCSTIMSEEIKTCDNCQDYKGVVNIVQAVGYYGKEILGYQKGKLKMNWKLVKEAQDKQRAKEVERMRLLLDMSYSNPNPRPLNNAYELGKLDR